MMIHSTWNEYSELVQDVQDGTRQDEATEIRKWAKQVIISNKTAPHTFSENNIYPDLTKQFTGEQY